MCAEAALALTRAGFEEQHILEILLAIAVKTLTNHANHPNYPELVDLFASYAW